MKILLILHSPTWNLFFFYYEPYPKVVTCTRITNHQVTLSSKEVLHQMNPFFVKGVVNISAKLSSMWIFLQQDLTIFYYFMYRLILCVSIWFFFFLRDYFLLHNSFPLTSIFELASFLIWTRLSPFYMQA